MVCNKSMFDFNSGACLFLLDALLVCFIGFDGDMFVYLRNALRRLIFASVIVIGGILIITSIISTGVVMAPIIFLIAWF